MRHPWLLLAIIMALIFTYVIASPLPSGKGKVSRSHSRSGSHGGPVGGRNSMSNVRAGSGAGLDTLEMIQRLESAGISQVQAKAITEAISSHFKSHKDTAVKLDMSDITRVLDKVGIPKEKAEVVKEAIDQSQG